MVKERQDLLKPFTTGQVWELVNSRVRIGHVGKMLVSYQHFKGKKQFKVPTVLVSKQELQEFLCANKAVLV